MDTSLEKRFYYWEDFIVGQVMVSEPYTVTEEEIIEFAEKYDPQRFHMDPELAKDSIFNGLIASGWQTASLMMRMACDAYILNSSSNGSPGLESLKWLKPVRPRDTLMTKIEVLETRPLSSKPHLGIIRCQWQCFNQHDELTTTIDAWGMFGKRPTNEVS